MDSLLIGWWWGNWESASSTSGSTQCGVYTFVGSTKLTSPTWWGFLYLLNSSKDNEWLRMLPIALEEELRLLQFSSVRLLSRVRLFATPWTAAHQTSLSISNSWSLLKLRSIDSVRPSNHLILCHPLLLEPSIIPSIRVFSNESALCIRWPKYWSFSFSISPSNEYLGLISFTMDWFGPLAVQGPLKSLLQHHSSKASILQHSAFFIVQLSHLDFV